ncbi:synaptopodin-2-like [Sinocyclocheilus rhinocerous]|nr:PREDICTED: synaptopodin-2-like [Sinocyclocheilus rhinocerous]
MGTGEFACVMLRGGAPWGFTLRQSAQDPQHPIQLLEIEDGSPAAVAGLCENDELVSVNGKPCSNLSLSDAIELIEASADCLQLLVKRCCSPPQESFEMVSTTFRIPSPSRPHEPQGLYTSESQDEAYYGETDSDGECPVGTRLVRTQLQIPASWNKSTGINAQGGVDTSLDVTPGSVVELQLSLSKTTLEEPDCTALGSAYGVVGDVHHRKTDGSVNYTTTSFSPGNPLYIPRRDRQPLGQRGVLVSKPPALTGQVEVTLKQLSGSSSGKEGVEASERLDSGGEEGGHTEEAPTSSSVSFGLPSEEWDSESEREVNEPNKHRARHSRLRRSESLSEKQVKEAKSKCKRIALLLSAPAPNPNNKGVLMFKKHRQRAKKYTLVSYGTGEDEPNYKDEDDKEEHTVEFTVLATSETETDEDFFTNASGQKSIVSFDWDTGLLEIERKLDKQQDMDALPETKGKGALMFAQRKQRMDDIVEEHEEMRRKGIPVEAVQETETHKAYQHTDEHTYMHAQETQNYMDVNLHQSISAQKQQQQQQHHQYQEQYYQQQQQQLYQDYQQQLQYQQQQHQYQQQQDYQQQKMYQHMQSYNQQQHCQQQQVQQYSHHMNGMFDQQMQNEMQPLVTNRSAKPFSIQNRVAAPFSSQSSADNQEQSGYSLGQGEQIASRDERISVPAIKTGILQDTRRRSANKPMFTFKESPKVSPNPALLNLLNKKDKKAGFESCPEEDYLSLGAEACNFLQSPKMKHKIPPPVAPKPHLNPASPPWSTQQETIDQPSVPAPAEAPVTEADAAPAPKMGGPTLSEQEPTLAPESHDVPHCPEQLPSDNAWKHPESQMELNQQPETWNEKQPQLQMNSALPVAPPVTQSDPSVRSWDPAPTQGHQQIPVSTWGPNEVQLQVPSQNQSQTQPQWMTQSQGPPEVQLQVPSKTQSQPWVTQPQASPPPKHPPQPQPQINSWAPSPNQSTPQAPWSQPHEPAQPSISVWQQDQNQAQEHPAWTQKQQFQQSQAMPHWASPPQQQPQPSWAQPQRQSQALVSQAKQQEPIQPSANAWTQPQSPIQAQPPWAQQTQPTPQPTAPVQQPMNPWPPMPAQSQPHPQWGQEPVSQQHSQQVMNSFTPVQNQIQPPWAQPLPPTPATPWAQKPQQQASQPPVSQWAPPQSQTQSAVNAWASQHQQSSVGSIAQNETQKLPPQPNKPWRPTQTSQPTPPRRMNSYNTGTKAPSTVPTSSTMSLSGFGSAFEMPALRGKGAELFAKRQSRMEKYIVDSTTVQSNKARPSSPSPSLPHSWKYSLNCRAPPPLAYNPIHSPSYPPGAIKQPPPSSPSTANKNKNKDKQKPAPKPLHVLDVMKHQPYQLNSSLFTYGPAAKKLAAEKEAAEKLAAQKAAEAEAQAQAQAQAQIQAQALGPPNQNQQMAYNQSPPPYGFMPQQAQQPYGMAGQSPMHDGLYHQAPPNTYQPALNNYQPHSQQVPYQQECIPQQAYQQPPLNPYQQAPSPPYQQPSPPSYQTGPNPVYQAGPALAYQPAPSSYVVPSYPVAARADSASGGSIIAAPKPKFSAKKSAAQVWKPSTPEK